MRRIIIAAGLLACLQFSARATVTEARVVVVKGSVTTKAPASTQEIPAVRDAKVSVGSTIGTGDKSSLLMQPNPGSAVMVLEKSRVVLSEDDLNKSGETVIGRKTLLDLRKGSVQAALTHPQGEGIDFKIKTPQCVAAARGTVLSTQVQPKFTVVLCGQGIVRVSWYKNATDSKDSAPGQLVSVDVHPGQELIVYSDGSSELIAAPAADLAALQTFVQDIAFLYAGGKEEILGVNNPVGGPDTTPGDPGIAGVPGSTMFPPQETPVTNK